MILTEQEFIQLKEIIEKKTGILFDKSRKKFLEMKLTRRLEELGVLFFYEYYQLLVNSEEFDYLKNLITINETYFYRNIPQLSGWNELVVPKRISSRMEYRNVSTNDDNVIRIFSAGCSSGEEPYTLAILLQESLPSQWKYEILAIDIDDAILEKAKKGIYNQYSLRDVPPQILKRYFHKLRDTKNMNEESNDFWKISDSIRSKVTFRKFNLIELDKMSTHVQFDFIFCRNVLIYFDEINQKKTVNHFYKMLLPGGYICLGHSEILGLLSNLFKIDKIGEYMAYKRPEEK